MTITYYFQQDSMAIATSHTGPVFTGRVFHNSLWNCTYTAMQYIQQCKTMQMIATAQLFCIIL